MKRLLTATLCGLAMAITASAADKSKNAAKAGPSGGRLIKTVVPHAEFLVNKDNKVEIRFVDDGNKVIAPGEQEVSVTLGDRNAPTKLAFTRDGNKLVSDRTIPQGNAYPTVVLIRSKAGAKAVNVKFYLNLGSCSSCPYKEYACICGHGDEDKK